MLKRRKKKDDPLSSCPSKSVSGLYEFLFKETFKAHDALEDSLALARILFKSKLALENKFSEKCISTAVFNRAMKTEVEARSRKCTLYKLPISNFMKQKLAKEGIDNNTLIDVHKRGGARGLLAILALPQIFSQINSAKQKPRITKNSKVLTKVIAHVQTNVTSSQEAHKHCQTKTKT